MDEKDRKKLCIDIGKRLYDARKAVGLTQDQAADIGDTYQQSISEAEHGLLFHPPDVMYRLCQAYGITCDYLISGEVTDSHYSMLGYRLKKLSTKQLAHFRAIAQHFFDALEVED